jgi:hypothetical protein
MKPRCVYSEKGTEFVYIIYMNSCSKMLKPGLVLQRNKKVATLSPWIVPSVASHKENKLTRTRYNECGCSFYRFVLSLYTLLLM